MLVAGADPWPELRFCGMSSTIEGVLLAFRDIYAQLLNVPKGHRRRQLASAKK